MRVAIITDQHFGVRNDDLRFADYFKKFYDNVFFPYLEQNNIDTILDLGDTMDRRKYINYHTLERMNEMWLNPIVEKKLTLHTVVGNHTAYFKNTNRINANELIFGKHPGVHVYQECEEIKIGTCKILLVPWINNTNFESTVKKMKKTKAQVLMGHLEIKGFQMYKNSLNEEHGFDGDMFQKFDIVYSGHFHHKSTKGNISYLGAPYEMTWSDYDDARGFHVFDTETLELEYIINPYRMFHKVFYDDRLPEEQIFDINFNKLKDTFVKVIVKNKDDVYMFNKFITALEKSDVIDMQIVDDHLNLDIEDDDDITSEVSDTLTILHNYVNQVGFSGVDNGVMLKFMRELYEEAMIQE